MKKLSACLLFVLAGLSLYVTEASAQNYDRPSMEGNSFMAQRTNVRIDTKKRNSGNTSATGRLQKGYRGMVEIGNGWGWGGPSYAFEVASTHGYQFNPYLYLGGMVGMGTREMFDRSGIHDSDDYIQSFNIRLCVDFRAYLPLRGRFSPFAGLQLGFDLYAANALIVAPAVPVQLGVRYALRNNKGLSFAILFGPTESSREILYKLGFDF